MKISWFQFVFLNTFLIVLLNFNGFIFVYKNLSSNQLWLTLALIIAYACLVHMILCVIFVRFLSKFFSIILLITAGMSAYFIQSYGVLIDSDMLRNVFNTDTKEAFDLVNIPLILLVLGLIIVGFLILKTTIFYPPFKKQLGVRLLNIFSALGIFCAIF